MITFKNKMISIYRQSIHDDSMVRTYLALAMGRTGDDYYGSYIIEGLKDEDINSRIAAIKALGLLSYQPALSEIKEFIDIKYSTGLTLDTSNFLRMRFSWIFDIYTR